MCYAYKWETTNNERNRIALPRENQKAWRKENLLILGHIGSGYHQTSWDERKNVKRLTQENDEPAQNKLHSRNLIKWINTWPVNLVWYSGPFLKWTREEVQQMDQRTRKLDTMYKALDSRDDVDSVYLPRIKGGREPASILDSVDVSIQRLENNIKIAEEDW